MTGVHCVYLLLNLLNIFSSRARSLTKFGAVVIVGLVFIMSVMLSLLVILNNIWDARGRKVQRSG